MSYPDENAGNNVLHRGNNIDKYTNNAENTSNGLKHQMMAGVCDETRKEHKAKARSGRDLHAVNKEF